MFLHVIVSRIFRCFVLLKTIIVGGGRSAVRKPFDHTFAARQKNGTIHEWRPLVRETIPLRLCETEIYVSSQKSAVSSSPSFWIRVQLLPATDGVLLSRCSHIPFTVNLDEWRSVVRTQFISFALSRKTAVDLILFAFGGALGVQFRGMACNFT
jgi:hypothetical protein